MIKSPLNYTGNKSRFLVQLLPRFPQKVNRFVDMCCGGASVGLNVNAKYVICFDNNKKVIDLLQTLSFLSEKTIVDKVEEFINEFNLSDNYNKGYAIYRKYIRDNNGLKQYNAEGYAKLRSFYNDKGLNTKRDNDVCLFTLLVFCFNNDLRFNSAGKFNMPVGKTDFNESIRKKLNSFKHGTSEKSINFIQGDFKILKEFGLRRDIFVYIAPPYLITNAVYNESGSKWDKIKEVELLSVLSYLDDKGIRFALSNVLRKGEKENTILSSWVKKNKFNTHYINYHYRSSSYNKKDRATPEEEVLITNYNVLTILAPQEVFNSTVVLAT
ncbi:MAG: Dam family site-specific DNA-(adenine-N6)-methyltransferase [Endomicrobium sp.]|jgi:DNA adenine methylase Dam|nr:Dam family site-specific DNA-(adenine-N6)-methyltransferase [Endomicrobium sp.]